MRVLLVHPSALMYSEILAGSQITSILVVLASPLRPEAETKGKHVAGDHHAR